MRLTTGWIAPEARDDLRATRAGKPVADRPNDTNETVTGRGKDNLPSAGGPLHRIGAAFHRVIGLVEPARHIFINLGLLAGILVGGPALYKQVTKSTFVIKDISVPPAVASRGLSGEVIAQQILDHIAEINTQAGSKKEKADITGFESSAAMPSINLPVGGLNLAAIISELRTLFGYAETKVTGEIYIAESGESAKGTTDRYGLRLRIAGQGPLFRSEQPSSNVEPLIDAAAQQIMRRYDPINLGYYYYRKKNFQRASELTDEVLASGNSNDVPWAFMMRGLIARDQGHRTEAAVALREAVARAPNFVLGYVTLAGVLRQNGSLDEAETVARKIIELAPTQHDGHAALAFILAERNKPEEALAAMQQAVDAEPKVSAAHFKAGRLQMRLHKVDDAAKSFKTSISLKPAVAPMLQAAQALHELKRDEESVELLHQATHLEPKNPRAWLALGVEELETKAYGRASRAFQKAIALDIDGAETLVAAAKTLDTHQRVAEAGHLFDHPPPKLVHDPKFLLGWAEHLWVEGHKQDAAAKVREALAAESAKAPDFESAAHLLAAHGETAAAIDAYKHAIVLDPSLERTLQAAVDKLSAQRADVPVPAPARPAANATPPAPVTPGAPVAAVKPVPPVAAAVSPVLAPAPTAVALPKPATVPTAAALQPRPAAAASPKQPAPPPPQQ